jgi:hypothetical protein
VTIALASPFPRTKWRTNDRWRFYAYLTKRATMKTTDTTFERCVQLWLLLLYRDVGVNTKFFLDVNPNFLSTHSLSSITMSWMFKLRRLGKKDGPSPVTKSHFFLDTDILVNEITNLSSNFTWKKACFLSFVCRKKGWGLLTKPSTEAALQPVAVSKHWVEGNGRIHHKNTLFFVSFDRYGSHLAPYTIWR